MQNRNYAYQYDTNPRKIKPDYSRPKKKSSSYNKSNAKKVAPMKKTTVQKVKKPVAKDYNKLNAKQQKKLQGKAKVSACVKGVAIFAILFLIIFRNSQISQSFSEIQSLKAMISDIQKENDQLEINIQNSINLSNIEQQAKELLGMQKLSGKQTEYITLPKKDYIEPRTEEVVLEESTNWFEEIIEKIKNLF